MANRSRASSGLARQLRGGAPHAAVSAVTSSAPHLRDTINVHRAMTWVVWALLPNVLIGIYNTGLQANVAMAEVGIERAPGWRGALLDLLRVGYDPGDVSAAVAHGAVYFLPVLILAFIIGEFWERLFARLRRRERGEGLVVIALLFTLSLPPTVPLWQVALGMSFGVVVGREIFGGIGKNFLNPALVGLAFLYAAYPQQMVSEAVWLAVDAFTGPTELRAAAEGGMAGIAWLGTTWLETFFGFVPGAMGATSAFACLLGAGFMLYKRIVSARIMVAVVAGMIATVLLLNLIGGDSDPFYELPWYWHLTLGSFAFGAVFLATDPVSAASTRTGRWIYGLFIGVMVGVIRVANPAHPDGVLFAILLGNVFAPTIDYLVVRANIRRRARRGG